MIFTVLPFLALVAAAPTLDMRQSGCTAYEVISARGTGESQTRPFGNTQTVNAILKAVPNGANHEVVYPAVADFVNGPKQGASDIVSHVNTQLAACPNMKFVLIGYSQGAMAVVTAENDAALPREAVVGTILYGNPFWQPNKPEDAGTATAGRGSAAASRTATPAQFQAITKDFCNNGLIQQSVRSDIVCTSSGSIIAHLGYPGSPQQDEAVAFGTAQLQGAGL